MRLDTWGQRTAVLLMLLPGMAATQRAVGQRSAAGEPLRVIRAENGPNSAQAQTRHYVVLVMLEGFRADYLDRDHAAHLMALGKQGARAPEGMLPSYPATGTPNRYTVVTGLYPGNHGLVADSFYDPARKARFSAGDPKSAGDGSWYGGVPLWSLAESQGMRSACIAWTGSAAKIAGFRPSYSVRDEGRNGRGQVEQVLKWLRLPESERPHLIAVDLPEPGSEAMRFGPEAPQTTAAVHRMDDLVDRLKAGLDATGLPVDLVVVSDRGLAKSEGGWITLDQYTNLGGIETDGSLLYAPSEQERARIYRQLNHVSSFFVVYRRAEMPPELHARRDAREGDPVVMRTGPYAIRARGLAAGAPEKRPLAEGVDGMAPQSPQMRAIFVAAGPDIVPGKIVGPFENVNLYPWIAHLLDLKAPKSDGSPNILSGTLRDDGVEPRAETSN